MRGNGRERGRKSGQKGRGVFCFTQCNKNLLNAEIEDVKPRRLQMVVLS